MNNPHEVLPVLNEIWQMCKRLMRAFLNHDTKWFCFHENYDNDDELGKMINGVQVLQELYDNSLI